MATLAQKTDVELSKVMGEMTLKVQVHQLRRTIVRAMIADFLLTFMTWVAPWNIHVEFVADEDGE
jgi:hypothetical protein